MALIQQVAGCEKPALLSMQTSEGPQKGGLARAIFADEFHALPGLDGQRYGTKQRLTVALTYQCIQAQQATHSALP